MKHVKIKNKRDSKNKPWVKQISFFFLIYLFKHGYKIFRTANYTIIKTIRGYK